MNAKRGYVPEDERYVSADAFEITRRASGHVCCSCLFRYAFYVLPYQKQAGEIIREKVFCYIAVAYDGAIRLRFGT